MRLARWVRRLAFLGAAGCVAAAALPGGADASTPTSGPNIYSTSVQAHGLQYILNSDPDPTPFANLIDVTIPSARSELLAGGLSSSTAESVGAGGSEGLGDDLCLVFDSTPLPKCPPGFPPAWQFGANASYPTQPSADAPVSGSVAGAILGLTPGRAHAEAAEKSTSASAGATDGSALAGTPLAVSTGDARSTSNISVTPKGVLSIAESTAKNIDIGGVLTIKSVTTHLEVLNDGVHKPVSHSSVTVQGAELAGQAVTIDDKGVHVAGQGAGNPLGGLGGATNPLETLGLDVHTVGVSKLSGDAHSLDLQGIGLSIQFEHSFEQLCVVSQLCNPLPRLCKQPPSTGTPFDELIGALAVAVDVCQPSLPSPRTPYFTRLFIASAGLDSYANSFSLPPPPPPPTLPSTTGTTGGLTTGTAGGVQPPLLSGGSTGLTTGGGSVPPPVTTAGGTTGGGVSATGYVENFGDAAKRIKYLFPALILAVIGVLAGRLRHPARLPKVAD